MQARRWMTLTAALAVLCFSPRAAWSGDELPAQIAETVQVVNDFSQAVMPLELGSNSVEDPQSAAGSLRLRSKMLTKFAAKLEGLVADYPAAADRATERLQVAMKAEAFPPTAGTKMTVARLRTRLPQLLDYAVSQAHEDLERAAFFDSMPIEADDEEDTKRAELIWRLNRR